MQLHTHRALLLPLFVVFLGGFFLLGWLALAAYKSPLEHLWDLTRHDRIFQLVLYDFLFFFVWVFLWMIDRGKARGVRRIRGLWWG
jgi:lysylphosphatidylglycerol synthetase-like protein (DUF2156 family)